MAHCEAPVITDNLRNMEKQAYDNLTIVEVRVLKKQLAEKIGNEVFNAIKEFHESNGILVEGGVNFGFNTAEDSYGEIVSVYPDVEVKLNLCFD